MAIPQDPLEPKTDDETLTALATGAFYIGHPLVTLAAAWNADDDPLLQSPEFRRFAALMAIFKGGPILVDGLETNWDASLHTGSAVFASRMREKAGKGALPWWVPAAIAASTWYFDTHNVAGILAGALIGRHSANVD